jgi:hypothetical protein
MSENKTTNEQPKKWLMILTSGLGVAIFTFAAPIIWQKLSHKSAASATVDAVLRVEDNVFLVMVRNNSDDALDLVGAEFEIDERPGGDVNEFGAYPEPSHVYQVSSNAQFKRANGKLAVSMKIAQAIDPGKVDQFGLSIKGPAGALALSPGSVKCRVRDVKGNVYPVKY